MRTKNTYFKDLTGVKIGKLTCLSREVRKNNSVGYTLENCVPCCGICNKMKMNLDFDTFIEKCKLISNKHD